jgi:hypothetical protein
MSIDATAKSIRLVGKGTDTTGGSGASMDLMARLEATGDAACNLLGNSDVSMSGKAAAFGGRMMGSVADQILKQFAANFANRVQALQGQAGAAPPAAGSTAAQPAVVAPVDAKGKPNGSAAGASTPTTPSADSASTASASGSAGSAPAPDTSASVGETSASATTPASAPAAEGAAPAASSFSAASQTPRQPVNELNALALLWAVFKDWLRSLFGAKRA